MTKPALEYRVVCAAYDPHTNHGWHHWPRSTLEAARTLAVQVEAARGGGVCSPHRVQFRTVTPWEDE